MITCSRCGDAKGKQQGWFFAWVERGNMRFCVMPWDEDPELQHESSVHKLCGLTCLTVTMAKWVGKGFERKTA